MKTRENELHEPKIEARKTTISGLSILPFSGPTYMVGYECTVCGDGHMELVTGWTEKQAIERFKLKMDNYCPRCGARMKEIPYAKL